MFCCLWIILCKVYLLSLKFCLVVRQIFERVDGLCYGRGWLNIDIINTRNHFQLSLYLYRVINDAKGPIPAQTDKSQKN